MEAQLQLFLFAILLTSGTSLKCEECSGKNTCTGNRTVCAADEDACAAIVMESVDGDSIVFKKCASSMICHTGLIHVKVDKGNFLKDNISCCLVDGCNPDITSLPKTEEKRNGKVCPSCTAIKSKCPKQVVYCTGNEDHCLSLVLIRGSGKKAEKSTRKGCTTASTCATYRTYSHLIPGFIFENVSCVPAKDSQIKEALPSSGFFLMILLLVEMFIMQ